MKYSIDTSALLHAWYRAYPPKHFPGLWHRLDGLIEAGDLLATEEVLVELEKKQDDCYKWVKVRRQKLIVPIDGRIQQAVNAILAAHERLVDQRRSRSQADPFVIALAQIRQATVVTEEPFAPAQVRIPNVCQALKIPCVNLLGLIQAHGWMF